MNLETRAALPKAKDSTALVIYAILLGLLAISYVLALAEVPFLATAAVMAIAAVKAILVGAYYMNLRLEPLYILFIVLAGLFFTLTLLALLVPDLVYYHLWGWMGRP